MFENDYREILNEEFEKRHKVNPRYSQRAFARDLSIQASHLSEVLSGKHGLSLITATNIANKLGFDREKSELFCDMVQSLHAKNIFNKKSALTRIAKKKKFKDQTRLSLDHFKVVSDWYHFAILELTSLKYFQSDAKWIAARLGIHTSEAKSAIDRLLRLNLLKRDGEKIVAVELDTVVPSGESSSAIQKYHQQILGKAQQAVVMKPVAERDFSSMTFAMDSAQMQKARELIKDFRRNFCREMELSSPQKNAVYCVSIQFFDLLERRENEK